MRDFATSDAPEVQRQLDRLAALSVPQGRLGLDTIRAMLARLGEPQRRLPPAFHVAGTNGKGSTCAYLRAILEAQGLKVHATTSPHLVRYNERIRVAGALVQDTDLARLLSRVLDACENLGPSFFEVTIAASLLAFAETPADACVIEVGLGGRFDATNVLENPAACGIATLGIDHEAFLLAPETGTPEHPLARIAFEKASIAKAGRPLVTQAYPAEAQEEVRRTAERLGAKLLMRGRDWWAEVCSDGIAYRDGRGALSLPLPALPGAHQADNAALAVAMLRHQDRLTLSTDALAQGICNARWPARMQPLAHGPLASLAPGHAIWLDGGHNPDAGRAIARHFEGQRLHLVIGMMANKDAQAISGPLAPVLASIRAVDVPGKDSHPARAFGPRAVAAASVEDALSALPDDGLPVLVAGSLYLAGEVLRANGQFPD